MIMYQQFVDRGRELEFLESRYLSRSPELIILYGRRRIGKTRLINEFLRDKPGIYFLCVEYSEIENLRLLQMQMGDFLGDESFKKLRVDGLEELFSEFFKWWTKNEKIVLAIDEFPYLIALNKGVLSAFQRIWDLNLSKQNVMLILSGSSIGMMETEVLGYRSPLYGRRTGQWRLEKLEFSQLKNFFPSYSMKELIWVYASIDSIPEYLLKFSPTLSFWENLRKSFVSKGSFLYEEAEILLREEFREPHNYILILRAIAEGKKKLAEIASTTGLDKGALSRYIYNLQRVGIVDAQQPAAFPKKSKRSLYTLTDNYFKFYFRFVLPNKNNIEAETDITPKIKKEYDSYLGSIFEELARNIIMKKINLGFSPDEVSSWWHKGEEIDIVALSEESKDIAFFECKWSNIKEKDAERIIAELKHKAALVKWYNQKRKEHYGIIARDIESKEELRASGILAYELEDFEVVMK